MDKTGRNGLRVGDIESKDFKQKYQTLKDKHLGLLGQYPSIEFDLEAEENKWFENIRLFSQFKFIDAEYFLNQALDQGKRILAEGAQGSMLDIDFGTYPFVTSSNTLTSGVCSGLGIAPQKISEVIGITKAYCTRVGSGPFPTELGDATGEQLRQSGFEFGSTTGRPRRCGWIDIPQLVYTVMLNGVTQLVMTKIDVLNDFESIGIGSLYEINGKETAQLPYDLCDQTINPVWTMMQGWKQSLDGITNFDQLPTEAIHYIHTLSKLIGVPFSMISTGPEREKLIKVY
ncbi:MAG: adenylosuccinate synthetase, partial [Saprospiraceae bacterium]